MNDPKAAAEQGSAAERDQTFSRGATGALPSRAPSASFERTLERFREFELVALYRKVCRVPERPRSRPWVSASGIFFGGGLGGLLAGIPLLSSSQEWDPWVVPVYGVVTAATFLIAGICLLCARSIQGERTANLGEVRDEFRELLMAYGMDPDDHDPTTGDSSPGKNAISAETG